MDFLSGIRKVNIVHVCVCVCVIQDIFVQENILLHEASVKFCIMPHHMVGHFLEQIPDRVSWIREQLFIYQFYLFILKTMFGFDSHKSEWRRVFDSRSSLVLHQFNFYAHRERFT